MITNAGLMYHYFASTLHAASCSPRTNKPTDCWIPPRSLSLNVKLKHEEGPLVKEGHASMFWECVLEERCTDGEYDSVEFSSILVFNFTSFLSSKRKQQSPTMFPYHCLVGEMYT